VYLVYPALIMILGARRRKSMTSRWGDADLPSVTMICAAYNEAAVIAAKVENTLGQDYPPERLDLIIVDDGSTDGTAARVRDIASARVTLLEQPRRRGKTAALNRAVEAARGSVLVFTDANALFDPAAVRHLVTGFDAAEKIGVVCGEVTYRPHPQAGSGEESRYWDWEALLKRAESNLGTMLGAHGPIHAVLRDLYIPLPEDMINDFTLPLLLAARGYRTVYQPPARSVETGTRDLASEFRRKRRIIQRSLYALWKHPHLLNPFASGRLAVQLWAHKVLRWLTPLWLLGLLVSSGALSRQPLFAVLLALQLAAYGAGFLGLALHAAGNRPGPLRLPAYMLAMMGASLAGIYWFVRGKKFVTWEPQR